MGRRGWGLGLLVLAGATLAGTLVLRADRDPALPPPTDVCEQLGPGPCGDSPDCAGVYGPTCPTCKNLLFKGCVPLDDASRRTLAHLKAVCAQTHGRWLPDSYKFGRCECPAGPYFDGNAGCLDIYADCEKTWGSKLYRSGDACTVGGFPACRDGKTAEPTCTCPPWFGWFGLSAPRTLDEAINPSGIGHSWFRHRRWLPGPMSESCSAFTWPARP